MAAVTVPHPPQPAAGAPLLELQGIGKRFGALSALDDVALDILPGEVHCLLGENGAGKSTLCNIIFGVYEPSAGAMRLSGQPYRPGNPAGALAAGVAMVHQHFSLVPTLSVVENLMLGQCSGRLKREQFSRRLQELAAEYGLALAPERRAGELSVGERQRVEIVKCLMREPRLLLLDEPTAVLPPQEIDALLEVCRRIVARGRGIVLVTHKLAEVTRVADRISVLRGGKRVASATSAAADVRALVRAMIGREVAAVDAQTAATLGLDGGAVAAAPASIHPTRRNAREVLQLDGIGYRDKAGVVRLDNVTLTVNAGEVVGVAGVEGNGQTELGNILAGLEQPSAGRWFIAGREMTRAGPAAITAAGGGIVAEDRHAVSAIIGMSVAENLFLNSLPRFSRFGLLRRKALTRAAAGLMARFDVRAHAPDVPFGALSGGNQQKAVLARELTLEPLVFLLAAQPTRGLDLGAVEAVYGHIRAATERGVGVLLISSELDELIAASDRIAVMYRGRIAGELPSEQRHREAIGALMSGHGV